MIARSISLVCCCVAVGVAIVSPTAGTIEPENTNAIVKVEVMKYDRMVVSWGDGYTLRA